MTALSQSDIQHFLDHGYVTVKDAFTRSQAAEFIKPVWIRLGYDPNDQSTWTKDRINMPRHYSEDVRKFSPKTWQAICELLGGEDRVTTSSADWDDRFIVNLGMDPKCADSGWIEPDQLDTWHVDGDLFLHFLDSPEQALLVIPIFTDIKSKGGATIIAQDSIAPIARLLADHPEGVSNPDGFKYPDRLRECSEFVELTGIVGDVVLMHPFMLHTWSRNIHRTLRVITNPPVSLKVPFNYNRDDPNEYSVVERKTLMSLGVDHLPFHISAPRRDVVPERIEKQRKMKDLELQRLLAVPKIVA